MCVPKGMSVLWLVLASSLPGTGRAQQPAPVAAAQSSTVQQPPARSGSLPEAPSTSSPTAQTKKRELTVWDSYEPLSRRQKLDRWLQHTYSPYTFVSTVTSTAWAQATGGWPSYGGGVEGFGKRLGATFGDTETNGFFKVFLLPGVLHQDPRYFPMRRGTVRARAEYAATRVFATRKDDGANTFNSSEVIAVFFVRAAENLYLPPTDRGFRQTMTGAVGALLGDVQSNLLREFRPDISRIFHKHEPEKIKNVERHIPVSN
jgi:hypothetical protein